MKIIGIVAVIAALAATALAHGGRTGRPREGQTRGPAGAEGSQRGMMTDMSYLERSWTALCFQIETNDEQFSKLWELYREVLTARNTATEAAIAANDMQAYRQANVNAKSTLDTKLPEILNDEQRAELERLLQPAVGMGRGGTPWGQGQGTSQRRGGARGQNDGQGQ